MNNAVDENFGIYVVSDARKLILEVGNGPTVQFPANSTVSGYGANNDTPVVVVRNATDTSNGPQGTWQGAGSGDFVIINEVPGKIAERALEQFDGTVASLNNVLAYLTSHGYSDQYTTTSSFVQSKLSPAGKMKGRSGIVKRDDRDQTRVYRNKKGVLVIFPGGKERHIEPDILVRTYRMPNGDSIKLKSIPTEKKPGLFSWMHRKAA